MNMKTMQAQPFLGSCSVLQGRNQVRGRSSRMAVVPRAERSGLWLPGTEAPKWLDGSLPADRGFDPLGLATDSDRLEWFVAAERYNAQIAMMGVAGILGQELLGVQPKWFEAGAKEYWLDTYSLTALEFLLFGLLELTRYQGWRRTKDSGVLTLFPFDPLSLTSEANRVKELKNGRLAMVAFVGFTVQALLTREGPIEGLQAHLADPFGHNIITNVNRLPELLTYPQ
ncbi:hypothetical protein WJX73_009738 [Symbiochloris irregularis]|uniref:Chlorophyll a-b binding protein, chloroplastic n=1 Tax=Symbiochloris irregularis TaxID=706552 RepID=A0AAW1PS24_9CHLO